MEDDDLEPYAYGYDIEEGYYETCFYVDGKY